MNELTNLKALKFLFDSGILKETDGDFLIFDKGRLSLHTSKKDYSYSVQYVDVIWDILCEMEIPTK